MYGQLRVPPLSMAGGRLMQVIVGCGWLVGG